VLNAWRKADNDPVVRSNTGQSRPSRLIPHRSRRTGGRARSLNRARPAVASNRRVGFVRDLPLRSSSTFNVLIEIGISARRFIGRFATGVARKTGIAVGAGCRL